MRSLDVNRRKLEQHLIAHNCFFHMLAASMTSGLIVELLLKHPSPGIAN